MFHQTYHNKSMCLMLSVVLGLSLVPHCARLLRSSASQLVTNTGVAVTQSAQRLHCLLAGLSPELLLGLILCTITSGLAAVYTVR